MASPLLSAASMQRTPRSLLVIVLSLALFVIPDPQPVHACGFSPEGVTVEEATPALLHLLRDDELPLLDPGWRTAYWVIAWARIHGKHFSDAEVATLTTREIAMLGPARTVDTDRWPEVRAAAVARLDLPDAEPPTPYRRDDYAYRVACGPDVFETAARTLEERALVLSDNEQRAWIKGQDQVFARCSRPSAPLPEAPAVSGSDTFRADREYQRAAARAIGSDAAAGAAAFDAIAQTSSPWADIARYRAAYLLASIDQADAEDVRTRLSRTTDAKARRGLQQVLDRVALYPLPANEAVETLGRRLIDEDLGEDAARVVRDLALFSLRPEACGTELGQLVQLRLGSACADALALDTPALEIMRLGAQRLSDEASDTALLAPSASLAATPLRIVHAFHEARHRLSTSERGRAQAAIVRVTSLVDRSSNATQYAFQSLRIAIDPRHASVSMLTRVLSDGSATWFADARTALRSLSSARWLVLLDDIEMPLALRTELAVAGFVRALLDDDVALARRFAAAALVQPERAPAAEETPPVDEEDGEDDEEAYDSDGESYRDHAAREVIDALRPWSTGALDDLDPLGRLTLVGNVHTSIEDDELGSRWGSLPESGCELNQCLSRGPEGAALGIAYPIVVAPSAERQAIDADGSRLVLYGRLLMAAIDRAPDDPRAAELLGDLIGMTRSASMHGSRGSVEGALGRISRGAYVQLQRDYPETEAARAHRHWYR